ncbi:serine/threonine-protein kinase haspin [Candoia aspera]|uniref:serine/threonine-protein kinase haspin n=1 Tax=Candoia aspera TaxID=51853 RepID=UPI002FD7E829
MLPAAERNASLDHSNGGLPPSNPNRTSRAQSGKPLLPFPLWVPEPRETSRPRDAPAPRLSRDCGLPSRELDLKWRRARPAEAPLGLTEGREAVRGLGPSPAGPFPSLLRLLGSARMEQLRPRLLRTYSGLRGRAGRGRGAGGGAGGRPALRLLPRRAPWISPPADPKRFFSTSSSEGASCSPRSIASSLDDPDFRPPARAQKARKPPVRKGGKRRKNKGEAKENRPPLEGSKGSSSPFVPPTPLRRNITCRRHQCEKGPLSLIRGPSGLRRAPLLCSTPELPHLTAAVAKRDWAQEEQDTSSPVSCPPGCRHSSYPWEVFREGSQETHHGVLMELSSLKMDPEAQEMGDSLELISLDDARRYQQKSVRDGSRMDPALREHFRETSGSPFQGCSALQCCDIWSGMEASPVKQEHSLAQVADKDHAPRLSLSTETNPVPLSPARGVFQLQARMQDDKIVLCSSEDSIFLASEEQLGSAQVVSAPQKMAGKVNKVLEGVSHHSTAQNSPQFQPVVVLDDQVVLNWLADQSTRKQKIPHSSKRKQFFLSQSPCALPKASDMRNNHRVVPSCDPGSTGRKACISGFSSKRWGQRQKVDQATRMKNTGWKQQADSFLLQERLKWNEIEDHLSVPFLPLDSSLKNSSLWRRIRASFSLHKKKKILSETESFNSSAGSSYSAQSPLPKACNTPFTQKLGYSICPASSMVLLSSMTSLSVPETMLTDAEKVYGECQQQGPVLFGECISPEKMQKCEKIGEGVFGEVFKTESERGTIALKIIPIEGSERVNGEPQKTFSEILPEIIISKELSLLADEVVNQTSGFIRLYSVYCVQGTYPEHLLNAWDEYHRLKESENNRPDFFGDQQLFMVLEFEFGGTDLENMQNRQLSSVAAAKSILQQVTASLAVAEEALRFEHRDLHWGNVLVRKTSLKEVTFTLNGEVHVLSTRGILVNIIDYTFSRLERDGLTVYCDLSTDEEVFQGRGDYQFDIYRQMREENANNWGDYFPHSNILWLHYLADKLLKEVSYKKKPTTSSLKQIQKQLRMFSAEVLNFKSATELLNLSIFFQ